jgi:hypothetical protein
MIFNGQTPESISALDETTMLQIQTMYADGMLGNGGVINLLGTLVNGVFNYIRPKNTSPYQKTSILGTTHDYIYPPLSQVESADSVNNSLLAFISQAPGFTRELFEVKNG